jgi:hypothetical protein
MKTQHKTATFLIAGFTALSFLISPIQADEVADLDKHVKALDKNTATATDKKPDLNEVSKKTGVPSKQLEKQQRETKLGAGSLFIANTLAKKTGKSFDEIVAEHKSGGRGWGKVAKDNGVKLGPLVSEAKKLEKQQRAAHQKNSESKQKKNGDKSKKDKGNSQSKEKGKSEDTGSKGKSKKK